MVVKLGVNRSRVYVAEFQEHIHLIYLNLLAPIPEREALLGQIDGQRLVRRRIRRMQEVVPVGWEIHGAG
jgi:hypothetical protein